MRSVAALQPAPKRMRVECEEGEEQGEKQGEEQGERKQGTVVVRRARQSALKDVFEEVQRTFEKWRMGGQYVDTDDLLHEFRQVAMRIQTELKAKREAQRCLSSFDAALLRAIGKRLEASMKIP